MLSTENKAAWVNVGVAHERSAIDKACDFGLPVIENPQRANSRYVIDAAVLCDIKTRRTPFRKSEELYRIPTRKCVTLNVADAQRYPTHALLLFDVQYEDPYVNGQWVAFLSDLIGHNPEVHRYERRVNDAINKQDSYVLDLAWMKRIA